MLSYTIVCHHWSWGSNPKRPHCVNHNACTLCRLIKRTLAVGGTCTGSYPDPIPNPATLTLRLGRRMFDYPSHSLSVNISLNRVNPTFWFGSHQRIYIYMSRELTHSNPLLASFLGHLAMQLSWGLHSVLVSKCADHIVCWSHSILIT